MLKHIGKHGDRKVAIIFREVPKEDHMCLVVYPEVLPSHVHDSIMKTLESEAGQAAASLADVLHRNFLPDGRVQLLALHQEGMIKKVPCNQIVVTPNNQSSVKLDELNRIIREMETGESAVKRLRELDAAQGMVDPYTKRKAEAEFKKEQQRRKDAATSNTATRLQAPQNDALDDRALATNMLAQAKRMEVEAKGMIAEAARMKKEAERLDPKVRVDNATMKAIVADAAPVSAAPAPATARRGRPSKAKTVAQNAV